MLITIVYRSASCISERVPLITANHEAVTLEGSEEPTDRCAVFSEAGGNIDGPDHGLITIARRNHDQAKDRALFFGSLGFLSCSGHEPPKRRRFKGQRQILILEVTMHDHELRRPLSS